MIRESRFKDLRYIRGILPALDNSVSGSVSLQEHDIEKEGSDDVESLSSLKLNCLKFVLDKGITLGFQRVEVLLLAKGAMTYFADPSGEFRLVVGQ